MKALTKFLDIVDNINEWIGKYISPILIILMVIVVYDVVMRYFFNRPTLWAMEINDWLLLGITFFGGGYALLHKAHVNVSIVHDRFSPRVKAIVDLITYLVLFLICIILIWYGGETAWDSLISGDRTHSTWAPVIWPSHIIVPIGGVLIGLQCLAKWIRDWVMVASGTKLESKLVSGEGGIRG